MNAPTIVPSNLAAEINLEHERAFGKAREALEHARRCGELLLEAKQAVGHGGWQNWLKEHVSFSERSAQRYMKLAAGWEQLKGKSDTVSDLSIRDALECLSDTGRRLSGFDEKSLARISALATDRGVLRAIGRAGHEQKMAELQQRSEERERCALRDDNKAIYDQWTSQSHLLLHFARLEDPSQLSITSLRNSLVLALVQLVPHHLADLLPEGVLADMDVRREEMVCGINERLDDLLEWSKEQRLRVALPLLEAAENAPHEPDILISRSGRTGNSAWRQLDPRYGSVPCVSIRHIPDGCPCEELEPRGVRELGQYYRGKDARSHIEEQVIE